MDIVYLDDSDYDIIHADDWSMVIDSPKEKQLEVLHELLLPMSFVGLSPTNYKAKATTKVSRPRKRAKRKSNHTDLKDRPSGVSMHALIKDTEALFVPNYSHAESNN